uniref:C-type lectin domain-containing protein n=1 Tax=Meloidogyne floridensis TaxID=298350 RepID=A0A915P245_9BILA
MIFLIFISFQKFRTILSIIFLINFKTSNGQTTSSLNLDYNYESPVNSNSNENGGLNQCPDGWASRLDSSGIVYGYKVIMQDMINYYQARNLCNEEGGELVSIHSDEEEQFVAQLALNLLDQCQTNNSLCRQRVPIPSLDSMFRSFYIGLNRAAIEPYYDPTVVQTWADGSSVDYASVPTPGVPTIQIQPWGPGCPSGLNDTGSNPQKGSPEDCVCMYKGADGNINWNDISCYHKLAGGICKRTCNGASFGKMCGINGWQAIATCQSMGAKVASIHSDLQQATVTNVSQTIQTNCSWIGLHRNAILGGQIHNFWDDGSPSDYGVIVQV